MRPIKFCEWIEEPEDYDIPSHMVSPKFQGDINEVFAQEGDRPGTKYHYMQYTGVNDSNGKEIYEGDIVKVTEDDGSYITEVEYYGDCGYPAFEITPPIGYQYDSNVIMSVLANGKLEVIGNIYENPELLDKD